MYLRNYLQGYSQINFLALLIYRVAIKFGLTYIRSLEIRRKKVVIFGAVEAGVTSKRVLECDIQNHICILAFVDDDC